MPRDWIFPVWVAGFLVGQAVLANAVFPITFHDMSVSVAIVLAMTVVVHIVIAIKLYRG